MIAVLLPSELPNCFRLFYINLLILKHYISLEVDICTALVPLGIIYFLTSCMHLYKFFASLLHVPEYEVPEGEPEARSEEEPPVEGHNHEHQRVGEHN